jgi:hypothetical protein
LLALYSIGLYALSTSRALYSVNQWSATRGSISVYDIDREHNLLKTISTVFVGQADNLESMLNPVGEFGFPLLEQTAASAAPHSIHCFVKTPLCFKTWELVDAI